MSNSSKGIGLHFEQEISVFLYPARMFLALPLSLPFLFLCVSVSVTIWTCGHGSPTALKQPNFSLWKIHYPPPPPVLLLLFYCVCPCSSLNIKKVSILISQLTFTLYSEGKHVFTKQRWHWHLVIQDSLFTQIHSNWRVQPRKAQLVNGFPCKLGGW